MKWFVYILRVRGDELYVGVTTDYAKRLRKHQAGRGSKYVKGKLPIREGKVVMEFEGRGAHGGALSLEAHIKKLTKAKKEQWMTSYEPGQAYLRMLESKL